MDNPIILIFQLAVLIFSVMIHEISHGFMALKLGDTTAKDAGRLTLNPITHIDPIGSLFLPFFLYLSGAAIIGWAKPVPYNPFNLYKDMKYGPLKVALVGPLFNLLLAIVFAIIIRFGSSFINPSLLGFMGLIVFMNLFLAVFNLIPIPPLDGSKILMPILPREYSAKLENLGFSGIFLVFALIYFFGSIISHISNWLFVLLVGKDGILAFLTVFAGR